MNKAKVIIEEYSLPLIFGVLLALISAHFWGNYFSFQKSLEFPVNEIFMAIFFGLAMTEITHAFQPHGELRPFSKAILPILATLGGVIGPIAVYFILCQTIGEPHFWRGWGIVTATDIALAWLVARIIFGTHHPALTFLLLLAILDDAIGMGIIAIFYPSPDHIVKPEWIGLIAIGIFSAFILRKISNSFWLNLLLPSTISWLGLYFAHLHPALALVFTIPFLKSEFLTLFEKKFSKFVTYGLFFFGFVNAGVKIEGISNLSLAIFLSLLLGKTIGIFSFTWLGKTFGIELPTGMSLKDCLLIGIIAGIGLTVALFVTSAAYSDPVYLAEAKTGALLSAFCAPLAILLGRIIRK